MWAMLRATHAAPLRLLVHRADAFALVVAQHRTIDRARNAVEREFRGRAHVDDLVKIIDLCYGNVSVVLHGARRNRFRTRPQSTAISGTRLHP
jgi:hypothetical protein